jgi:hypothetical protein
LCCQRQVLACVGMPAGVAGLAEVVGAVGEHISGEMQAGVRMCWLVLAIIAGERWSVQLWGGVGRGTCESACDGMCWQA